ncbi:MAG: FtsQ-type POTRA domain-containing protein [Bacteriovoracaceae bacterium]|jgi:outer membrane protein assembly factor BamA|nr:hypothetical protein [Halobacteriovoraceae bacterium]MDP7319476.1 FtsQ-type POTRA domain-containing protein [Bacteriovoracaceae bacterium]
MRVFVLLFLFSSLTHAFDFKVKGNSKTSEDVVRIEIKDLLEQDLDDQVLNELKRRLWNLRVFSSVKVEKISENQILIQVEERWTTIPIAKFQGGGGSTYFTLGAYDINTFGSNTEIGAQYESLNNRPAGVLWLRKPQFLYDRNLKFGVDVWDINRIRYLFKRNGEDDGAYTLQRKKINLFTEKKWKNDQYLFGVQLEYHDDRVSDFGLTDEQIELNQLNGFSPDSDSISLWHSVYFHWGRLNY